MSQPESVAPGELLLSVSDIEKSWGDNHVLRGVDLDVARGEVVAIIGPSGSGKTTVLRSLNGLETPDAGTITFANGPAGDFSAGISQRTRFAIRDQSAMVFQHHNLFPHMTALENVIEGPVQVQKEPRAKATERALELLARVGLTERAHAYPHQLSGGQQQRVGIVRALALRPSLLLFDEPTSALDPELVGEVLTVISELAAEGWTMVLVTHELSFAGRVADRIVFMDGGVVAEEGTPDEVLRNPQQERTQRFLSRMET